MKFTVYMLRPYVSWEDVEAQNMDEAIAKCRNASTTGNDCNEITSWIANEEEGEKEGDGMNDEQSPAKNSLRRTCKRV